ncbi:MAG: NifU family protein [Acidimicrobiales bacterium]
MADAATNSTEPLLRITEAARDMVAGIRNGEENSASLALWLEINGSNGGAYSYDMWFQQATDAGPGDALQSEGDLTIVVAASSVDKLVGATLDVGNTGGEQGLVMLNPNTPPTKRPAAPAGLPEGDLSDPISKRILEVLEQEVNPQIAAHGGFADLVAYEEGTAYVRMLGGCQGCGLASVTLSQGITVAIQDAVPEVTSVLDVTDHASGENPYYEAAKK